VGGELVVADGIAVNPRLLTELRVDARVDRQGCGRVGVGPRQGELGEARGAERARPRQRFGWRLVAQHSDGARNSTIDGEGGGKGLERAGHLVERSARNGLSLQFRGSESLTTTGRRGQGDNRCDGCLRDFCVGGCEDEDLAPHQLA